MSDEMNIITFIWKKLKDNTGIVGIFAAYVFLLCIFKDDVVMSITRR